MIVLVILALTAAAELTAEESRKEVRMKTTRQLTDVLKELKVKHPVSISKEDLRELALREDAMNRYYALPGKAKPKKRASSGGKASAGGLPNLDAKADVMFDTYVRAATRPAGQSDEVPSRCTRPTTYQHTGCRQGRQADR